MVYHEDETDEGLYLIDSKPASNKHGISALYELENCLKLS